jgi:hypothetical protein
MSLRLHSLLARSWLHLNRPAPQGRVGHATAFVLIVIAVSLCFGALRVVDAAFSGALVRFQSGRAGAVPAALMAPVDAVADDGQGGVELRECTLIEVPDASADAITLGSSRAGLRARPQPGLGAAARPPGRRETRSLASASPRHRLTAGCLRFTAPGVASIEP